MEERTCKVCGETKPISEYYKHAGYADTKCKECAKAYSREYGRNHKEKIKAYRKEYYRKNKARSLERSKQWVENNREAHRRHCRESNQRHYDELLVRMQKYRSDYPDRYKARGIVSSKIQQGKLRKPTTCEVCGSEGYIEAHHEDYSKPLDIIWCCKKCHWILDEKRRKREKGSLLGLVNTGI